MKHWPLFLVILLILFQSGAVFAQDDNDGDGTPNTSDLCPNEGGPSWASGCPDSDVDHTPDINDACPDVGGPAWNLGCPEDQPQFTPTPIPQPTAPQVRQQPQQPAQQPAAPPEPASQPALIPSGPSVSLPAESGCVLTPAGGEPINIRAVPSMQGGVLGAFEPGNRAPAGLPVVVLEGESWYLSGGGWLVGRLMAGTPVCHDLPVLSFAESGTTLVNQDNSLSPSIPVGIGETRPAQLYLMPASGALLQQVAPRVQLSAGEGLLALRFPSLRSSTNEILIGMLMPLIWSELPEGGVPAMLDAVYVGFPPRPAEGVEPPARDTLLVDLSAQGSRPFAVAVSANGSLRLVGDNAPSGLRICSSTIVPAETAEDPMQADAVCAEGLMMPAIPRISVSNIGGVLLLNTEAVGRASVLVYDGRDSELIIQLLPGPNPSGGSTPLLSLNQGQRGVNVGFHRPTQGMIVTLH